MKRTTLLFLALILAASARADGTADLRAALARLPGRELLRATVSLQSESRQEDEDARPDPGRGAVDVEHGAGGLHVIYTADVTARAQQETRTNSVDPEKPTPTVRALRDLDAVTIIEAVDAASVLARLLDNARLTKDAPSPSGRQLTFAIKPKLAKSEAKHVKSIDMTLVVNLRPDGVPVSAESTYTLKAKFFLMSFEQTSRNSWSFGVAGDHLVALRHQKQQSGSGMGQKFSEKATTTVTVR
ncbi:MAG TPA: hypothetical protein VJ276_14325 [Thermoanaerobaculia bacterium]|nr:hypothetical protein [Thermoanaerobaculia bacterium]